MIDVIVYFILLGAFLYFMLRMRDITFCNIKCDSLLQVKAAALSHKWRFPSDMHHYVGDGKSFMKDGGVLFLALFQRIFKDKSSFFPLMMMCLAMHSFSSLLFYEMSKKYLNEVLALSVFLIFFFQSWSFQVILQGGFQLVSQFYFLLAISLLVFDPIYSAKFNLFFSGFFCLFMLFSSASSRKYLVLYIAGVHFYFRNSPPLVNYNYLSFIPFLGMSFFLLQKQRLMNYLALIFPKEGRFWEKVSLGLETPSQFLWVLSLSAGIFLFSYQPNYSFYTELFFIFFGMFCGLIFLIIPNFKENVLNYLRWSTTTRNMGRFILYREYLASIGERFIDGWRAEKSGFKWVYKFLFQVFKLHFMLSIFLFAIALFINSHDISQVGKIIFCNLIFLTPIFVGELSQGPQIGRSYHPSSTGLMMSMVYNLFKLNLYNFEYLFLVCAVIVVIYNFIQFSNDILPAKMAISYLNRFLLKNNVQEIYTYETVLNNSFVKLLQELNHNLKIHFIKSVDEVKSGFLIVPPLNPRSIETECYPKPPLIEDPLLEKIEHKKIKSFKTKAASAYWIHESEITSYRYLMVKDITKEHFKLGHGDIYFI